MVKMFLFVLNAFLCFLGQAEPRTIDYHIAAVDIKWDYAPSGYNKLNNKTLDKDRYKYCVIQKLNKLRKGKTVKEYLSKERARWCLSER